MKKKFDLLTNERLTFISRFSIAAVVALVIAFFIVTILSTRHLMNQVNQIMEHPYKILLAVGDIRTATGNMQAQVDRLLYDNTEASVADVRKNINSIIPQFDDALSVIDTQYLGSHEDFLTLSENLYRLQSLQVSLLAYAETDTRSSDEITASGYSDIITTNQEIFDSLERITEGAKSHFHTFYNSAVHTRRLMLIWATAILISFIFIIFLYRKTLKMKNRMIEEKNNLFDLVTNNIENIIFIRDINRGKFTYISDNVERIMGTSKAELMSNPLIFSHCLPQEDLLKILGSYSNPDEYGWVDQIHFTNPVTNEDIIFSIQSFNIADKNNPQNIAVLTDETEIFEYQDKLRAALNRAEVANVAKQEFLSRVSHEIRTPLNGIIGMNTLALQNLNNKDKLSDILQKMSFSSEHLITLINDVLDMSKIESGKVEITENVFDFRMLLESLNTIFYPQAMDKGLHFDTIVAGKFPEKLIGDSSRLNQILSNLLSNAVKFTSDGGRISLRVEPLPPKNNKTWICFQVYDSGIGIADLNAAGAGLGLPISKHFATLMGGDIRVESSLGEYSRFIVRLPFSTPRENTGWIEPYEDFAPGYHTAADMESLPGKEYRLDDRRILIVEDNELNMEIASELIAQAGALVITAANGMEAVQLFEKSDPGYFDLILMDVFMPVMDGYEATRKIRSMDHPDAKSISIIAMTANAFVDDVRQCLVAGMNDHVSKPISISEIFDKIETQFRRRKNEA